MFPSPCMPMTVRIVIEEAAACGVNITFRDHARVGVPVTLASLAVLAAWIGPR